MSRKNERGEIEVSREVADFIELNNNGAVYWEDDLLAQHSNAYINGYEGTSEEAQCMKQYSPMDLAKILINGWYIEQTPEEKALDYFKAVHEQRNHRIESGEYRGDGDSLMVVRDMLKLLGYDIPGITDYVSDIPLLHDGTCLTAEQEEAITKKFQTCDDMSYMRGMTLVLRILGHKLKGVSD